MMKQETRELLYKYMCFLGCPDDIAKRMLTGARGEKRTDVRRANECLEDFLQRTQPAKYERMMQQRKDADAYRHALAMARLIGEQVRRDIANEL